MIEPDPYIEEEQIIYLRMWIQGGRDWRQAPCVRILKIVIKQNFRMRGKWADASHLRIPSGPPPPGKNSLYAPDCEIFYTTL